MARQGRRIEALEAFRRAVAIPLAEDPRNVEAHIVAYNYMGVDELERGDLEAADASFRKMIELIPQWDAQVAAERRYSRYREGQRKLLSATVVAYSNLGIIASRRGALNDAVEFQDAAIEAAELIVKLEQGDKGASIGDMDRALTVACAAYVNGAVAYRNRAAAARSSRNAAADLEVAVTYLERAVAAHPGSPEAWNALGEMYYRVRRFADAETAFQEAVRLDGQNETYRNNLTAVGERLRR